MTPPPPVLTSRLCQVSDTCLMTVGHELHSLRVLDMAGNHQVTDVGVSAVALGCPDLRHLDLSLVRSAPAPSHTPRERPS